MEAVATRKICNVGMYCQRVKKRGGKGYLHFAHLQVQRCNKIAQIHEKIQKMSSKCTCSQEFFANSIGLKNHSLTACLQAELQSLKNGLLEL
jgi:hypothetical protein